MEISPLAIIGSCFLLDDKMERRLAGFPLFVIYDGESNRFTITSLPAAPFSAVDRNTSPASIALRLHSGRIGLLSECKRTVPLPTFCRTFSKRLGLRVVGRPW